MHVVWVIEEIKKEIQKLLLQLNGNEKALGLGQGTQSSEWDMGGLSHVLIQLCGSSSHLPVFIELLCFHYDYEHQSL